jgi:hypothetical protein
LRSRSSRNLDLTRSTFHPASVAPSCLTAYLESAP